MLHGMNNTYLYAAKKIIATWRRGDETVQITGTGFIINKDDNLIFVTNRHVVEPGYSDPNYKDFSIETMCFEILGVAEDNSMPRELVTINILNWDEFKFHPNSNNDVACLIGIDTDKPAEISFSIPYELVASDDWISQKLSVCDSIAYPGFPVWYDKHNNTPIFRMGTIASDPRLDYSCRFGEPTASRIAYEGFSSNGASGSPVFSIQKGFKATGALHPTEGFYREVKLIGVNAGHFWGKNGHSGISYMYKSSVILDIIG